jgi:hypothetical protein
LSTLQYLQRFKFSEQVMEGFFRPFFGGVLLDNELGTAAPLFRFYLKKFLLGRCFTPRCGIGDLPAQIWSRSEDVVRLHLRTIAEKLVMEPGHAGEGVVQKVLLNCGLTGERPVPLEGVEAVVLATDEPGAVSLLEGALPGEGRNYHGVNAVYFTSRQSLYPEPCLVLPSGRERVARHFCQCTNINPALAPGGHHLISATVLERQGWDDARLFEACRAEIAEVFPGRSSGLEPLRVVRVPRAVPHQPPPLPAVWHPQRVPGVSNVFLAGHGTAHASLDGVMQSGENAARLVLEHLQHKT